VWGRGGAQQRALCSRLPRQCECLTPLDSPPPPTCTRSSNSRVFFLDYDGTLTAGQHTSITLAPLEEVLQVSTCPCHRPQQRRLCMLMWSQCVECAVCRGVRGGWTVHGAASRVLSRLAAHVRYNAGSVIRGAAGEAAAAVHAGAGPVHNQRWCSWSLEAMCCSLLCEAEGGSSACLGCGCPGAPELWQAVQEQPACLCLVSLCWRGRAPHALFPPTTPPP